MCGICGCDKNDNSVHDHAHHDVIQDCHTPDTKLVLKARVSEFWLVRARH